MKLGNLKNGKRFAFLFLSFTMLLFCFYPCVNIMNTTVIAVDSVNNHRAYRLYDVTTKQMVKKYTLQLVDDTNVNDRSVIGSDGRFVDFTKNGTVKIYGGGTVGTGFIVDAHTIATAAHCVYSKGASYGSVKYTSRILVFNTDGSIAMTVTNIKQIHIPDLYISTSGGSNAYDYALITVEEDLSEYAMFNLGVMMDSFRGSGKTISVTGFPSTVNDQGVKGNTMYTGDGVILNVNAFDVNKQIFFTNDSTPGNSGGPVYFTTTFNNKTYYTVIGIVSASGQDFNIGTRITTDLLHFYKNNPNISW